MHVPSTFFPRIYFYIALGIFIATSVAEGWLLLHNNGILTYGKDKEVARVREIFKYPDDDGKSPVQLTILSKPLKIKAGQYVNICISSLWLGLMSFVQSHPFVVASWNGERLTKLELVIEPRRGWTKALYSRAIAASRLATVWSGPRPEPFLETVKKTGPYSLVNWDRSPDRKIWSGLGKNGLVSSSKWRPIKRLDRTVRYSGTAVQSGLSIGQTGLYSPV